MRDFFLAGALALCAGAAQADCVFTVNFDFNRAELRPDAIAVIDEVVAAYPRGPFALDGNADLVGSSDYNLRLSQRRADAVRARLVQLGVPNSAIASEYFGDTNPVEATTGPSEANRRVGLVVPGCDPAAAASLGLRPEYAALGAAALLLLLIDDDTTTTTTSPGPVD